MLPSLLVSTGIHLEVTPFIARATRGIPLLFRHQLQRSGIRQHDLVDVLSSSSSHPSSAFPFFSSPVASTTSNGSPTGSSGISHLQGSPSLRVSGSASFTLPLSPNFPHPAPAFFSSSSPSSSTLFAGSPKAAEWISSATRDNRRLASESAYVRSVSRGSTKASAEKPANTREDALQQGGGHSRGGGARGDKEKEGAGVGNSGGELDWTRVDLFAWDLLAENGKWHVSMCLDISRAIVVRRVVCARENNKRECGAVLAAQTASTRLRSCHFSSPSVVAGQRGPTQLPLSLVPCAYPCCSVPGGLSMQREREREAILLYRGSQIPKRRPKTPHKSGAEHPRSCLLSPPLRHHREDSENREAVPTDTPVFS